MLRRETWAKNYQCVNLMLLPSRGQEKGPLTRVLDPAERIPVGGKTSNGSVRKMRGTKVVFPSGTSRGQLAGAGRFFTAL